MKQEAAKSNDKTYSDEQLGLKLSKISESQESIQSVSDWIINHGKESPNQVEKIVKIWSNYLHQVSSKRKLTLLYLCNDVVQKVKSKKRAVDYLNEFEKVLPNVIYQTYTKVQDDLKLKVVRILNVWLERSVFSIEFVNNIKTSIGVSLDVPIVMPSSATPSANHRRRSVPKTPVDNSKHPELISKHMKEISAIKTERIKKQEQFTANSQAPMQSDPVNRLASYILLEEYNKILQKEEDARNSFMGLLKQMYTHEENQIEHVKVLKIQSEEQKKKMDSKE